VLGSNVQRAKDSWTAAKKVSSGLRELTPWQFNGVNDSPCRKEFSDWHRSRLELWNSFCQAYGVVEHSVPLFECDQDHFVQTKEVGKSRPRKVLRSSAAMEALMRREVTTVVDDHKNGTGLYDGIIYIMRTLDTDGIIVPRYIGKSETRKRVSVGRARLDLLIGS
jgi:hypothetical protein